MNQPRTPSYLICFLRSNPFPTNHNKETTTITSVKKKLDTSTTSI